jgi:asparagine synthase (glutamine-hydrolysing)
VSAIAGLWRFDGKSEPAADCALMLAALQIYGPHDGRQWSDGPLAMGRRLFRTLPEDVFDRQPLQSRDGRLTLVADVRLDNRDEIAVALGLPLSQAWQFCDAAVLLESLERWGEGALDRLVGEFAFALWDASAKKLMLARDFLGQRPLYYHRGSGFFAFASMAKGLHALAEVPYGPDEQAVAEAVTLIPMHGSRSFFKGIERVEPAYVIAVSPEGLRSRRYWQPRRATNARASSADYIEGLRHHLDQATQSRLRGANGVVGTHLSAGFDSGAVAATAARLLAPSGGKVVAFTAVPRAGYDGPDPRNCFGDEGPLAATTAATYPNIEHVLIRSGHMSPLQGQDRTFFLYERPIFNMCNAVWGRAIHDAARERKLGILLLGQMGNMTISYPGIQLLPELLRSGRLVKLVDVGAQLVANSKMHWRGVLWEAVSPFMPAWLWQWANETFLGLKRDILHYTAIRAECLADFDLAAVARERDHDFAFTPRNDSFAFRLKVLGRGDTGNHGKGTLAGWGIDWRDPTADKRLVEYCLSVPTEQYLANGVPRALAKRALADRLPQAVLNEKKRGYQGVDWHEGLTAARADVAAELDGLADCGPAARVLDIDRLKALVKDWPKAGWEHRDVMQPYRLALLRGLGAGQFLRKASRSNR